ncbi:MAG: MBL fold metallo-hydrolase [Kofleriaceae bacterium]
MNRLLLVLAGCGHPTAAAPQRAALTLTYLGVAGWQIEGGGKLILSDPYFSRPANADAPLVPDAAAITAHAPPHADLIVVGHSHYDHLLDAPSVALRTGAKLMGSASTLRVARATGVAADHLIGVKGGEDFELDGFSVRVIPSLHSVISFGGEVADAPTLPMAQSGYGEGGTYGYLIRLAGRQVLVLDTANFIERELEGIHPDIAIVAPGLRGKIHDYTCRLIHVLGAPPVVLVTHFDAWHEPPIDQPSEDADTFAAEVRACSPRTHVIVPKHFDHMKL